MAGVLAGLRGLSPFKKVVGAVSISLIATVLSTWLFEMGGTWAAVGTGIWIGVEWGWRFLQTPITMPGWAVLVIGIFALIALAGIVCLAILYLFSILRSSRNEDLSFLNYTEDTVDDVIWRWNWQRHSNNEMGINNLWCFCPECDAQLVYASRAGRNGETLLICEQCPSATSDESIYDFRPIHGSGSKGRVKATTMGQTRDEIPAPIEREILRRIRRGACQRQA